MLTERIPVADLRRGDALANGGRVTSDPTYHPSDYYVAEVDYGNLCRWPAGATVEVAREEARDARG